MHKTPEQIPERPVHADNGNVKILGRRVNKEELEEMAEDLIWMLAFCIIYSVCYSCFIMKFMNLARAVEEKDKLVLAQQRLSTGQNVRVVVRGG